jgi:hypothetical protein
MATYDCVVYLSSLPRIADRSRKTEVLEAFVAGAMAAGARTLIQRDYKIVDARLAVILGWVGTKLKGQHIQLRQQLIQYQLQNGNHIMPIDSSCFKFVDTNSHFLRYSLDGVFYNTNNYANAGATSEQWNQIQQVFPGLKLKPWRESGNHILLCLQRDGGWSMKGTDLNSWALETIYSIRKFTQRTIIVRPHPKAQNDTAILSTIPGVYISRSGATLEQDLDNAWAAIFYNSSSSVAAVLAGIPVFVHDNDCVTWKVANKNLAQIEMPLLFEREQWLYDLSACHWSDEQSRLGLIYKKFEQYF